MWCHKDWTLTQRNCLRLYQRMIVLLLSTGLFSTTLRPRVADLCSKNHRTRNRGANLQPVAFLSFISSKEVLLSPQSELSQPRWDSCWRWKLGQDKTSTLQAEGKECVWTLGEQRLAFYFTIKQSRPWSWHLCALYVVPWWTLSSLISAETVAPAPSTETREKRIL